MYRKVEQAVYSVSIIQHLLQPGMKSALVTQYRNATYLLHNSIQTISNEGILENGVSAKDRTPARDTFPFPQPGFPIFFFNSTGPIEPSDSGTMLSIIKKTSLSILVKLELSLHMKFHEVAGDSL